MRAAIKRGPLGWNESVDEEARTLLGGEEGRGGPKDLVLETHRKAGRLRRSSLRSEVFLNVQRYNPVVVRDEGLPPFQEKAGGSTN